MHPVLMLPVGNQFLQVMAVQVQLYGLIKGARIKNFNLLWSAESSFPLM